MILKVFLEKKRLFSMNGKKLEKYQLKRIRKLVKWAKKRSPFYKEFYRDVDVSKLKTIEDFSKLPILTKEILRENYRKIHIPFTEAVEVSTSGSSGEPVRILKSKQSVTRTLISGHPFFVSKYTGLNINKTAMILIWGENSVETLFSNPLEKYIKREKILINVMDPIDSVIDKLEEERPEMLITYPTMLRNIAAEYERRGLQPDFVKLIIVSAELATSSFIEKYERFFGAIILSSYISTETGMMAIDKPDHSMMYIIGDNAFLEVLRDGNPVEDEHGDIVVTELNNFACPIIRYSGLCDRGILTRDEVGRRSLKIITGRQIQDLISKEGKHISAYYATEIVEYMPSIKKFRIVQKSPNEIFVEIVTPEKDGFNEGEEKYEKIKKDFEEALEHPVKLEIQLKEEIKTEHDDGTFDVVRRDF